MKYLTLSILILASVNTYDIHVGSYLERSFQENDMGIDRARSLTDDELKTRHGFEIVTYPVAVYTQIVNGLNYKILMAMRMDGNTEQVDLFNAIVYSGPFGKDFLSQGPSITQLQKVEAGNSNFSEQQNLTLKNSLNSFLSNNKSEIAKINSVDNYENLVYDQSFYVVNAAVLFGTSENDEIFILSKKADGEYKVVNNFRVKQ